jgi:hypothetical protein
MLMLRALSRALSPTLFVLLACNAAPQLAAEPRATKATVATEPGPAPVTTTAPAPANGAPDPRLPIVGDPLGLLSRAPPSKAESVAKPSAKENKGRFDPGALMASANLAPQTMVPLERDPRAVARAALAMADSAQKAPEAAPRVRDPLLVREKSAAEVIGGVRKSAARPHVLFLYASYCRACRNVLPNLLPLVQYYRPRNVLFTAASVDNDPSAYERYAHVLNGVLPPVWIRAEGQTQKELVRAGLAFSGDTYSIPLLAVFDKNHRLVRQGGGSEIARLPQTLDALSQ